MTYVFILSFPLIPDSKHWQEKLHQQIFGTGMTDPTLQRKKNSPKNRVRHFLLETNESPALSKHDMPDFQYYSTEYIKLLKC